MKADFGTIYAEGVMRAVVLHMQEKRMVIDADAVTPVIKRVAKEELPAVMADMKATLEAEMGEEFLRYMLNVQINAVAAKVIAAL